MSRLPQEPATTPAASHTVDWTGGFQLVAQAVALHSAHPAHAAMVDAARLNALHRIELSIAESLVCGGTHPESAKFLAFAYVDRCVALASSALRA